MKLIGTELRIVKVAFSLSLLLSLPYLLMNSGGGGAIAVNGNSV